MKFDFQLPVSILVMMICCLIFPFLPSLHLPLLGGMTVTAVESIQALMLFGFAVFSFFYIRPFELSKGQKQFWLWSVAWWIMLFGRSTSWGRDYFPEVPKIYFRGISVLVIAPVVFMLFLAPLRQEIAYKFKHVSLPIWALILAFIGLLMSDGIEHNRFFIHFIFTDFIYKDLMEELYEFPLIIGLFLVAYPLMKQDCAVTKSTSQVIAEDDLSDIDSKLHI
ncbi:MULTISPECIES: hypothetical protein [Acinetobacter]|uniref:hypothetical protein n=1 Tax=Acinetobacter TaxID=469 RepID=UPI000F675E23|nr:hypothetical protein [Acinetobacter variabilis]MBO3660618.1 hypothetical protein [Acinetobacter variabilis]QXR20224.1 hypothetical protein EGK58_004870 [Acinetobacter variabilis]UNW07615.1 hypothetical protein MOV98_05690 [Acinetobacter variabilis]WKT74112.1 hypothetical protein Q3F87_05460 [Acinetobacter variabilis]